MNIIEHHYKQLPGCIYLAHRDFGDELLNELGAGVREYDRVIFSEKSSNRSIWAQDIWREPIQIDFESISEAVRILRSFPVKWALFPNKFHRRAELITAKIDTVRKDRLTFSSNERIQNHGCFALIAENQILASVHPSANAPCGIYEFHENKDMPPNRAYLKLWEALTRYGKYPASGDVCVDLGASPGGWSWVLSTLGADVISVDKAPLDPKIAALHNVTMRQESAFALGPESFDRLDWLFSDVICYPERLLGYVQKWIESGKVKHMICTVKLQGETDRDVLRRFMDLPNSNLVHLYHNKHEVTWFYSAHGS